MPAGIGRHLGFSAFLTSCQNPFDLEALLISPYFPGQLPTMSVLDIRIPFQAVQFVVPPRERPRSATCPHKVVYTHHVRTPAQLNVCDDKTVIATCHVRLHRGHVRYTKGEVHDTPVRKLSDAVSIEANTYDLHPDQSSVVPLPQRLFAKYTKADHWHLRLLLAPSVNHKNILVTITHPKLITILPTLQVFAAPFLHTGIVVEEVPIGETEQE